MKKRKNKWTDAITGIVQGVILNWKELGLILSLGVGVYDKCSEKSDARWIGQHLEQKQAEIQQLESSTEQPQQ